MRFEEKSLFSSPLYVGIVDPKLYDKKNIVDTLEVNYSIDPERNNWGDSNLHIYNKDWNNLKFQKVNTQSLLSVYSNVFNTFITFLNPKEEIKVEYEIVTFNVTNKTDGYMKSHSHLARKDCLFSAVHYLKVNEKSSILRFENPILYNQYMDTTIGEYVASKFNSLDTITSSYANNWNHVPVEDEIVIFPSYLKHSVVPRQQNSECEEIGFRISSVINLYLK